MNDAIDTTINDKATRPGSGQRGGLTEADIHAAATTLYKISGKRPTQPEVRDALGRGSYGPIGAALKTWKPETSKDDQAQAPAEELPPLPQSLQDALGEALETIAHSFWSASVELQKDLLEAERKVMDGKVADAEQQTLRAVETSDDLQNRLDASSAEVEKLADDMTAAQEKISACESEIVDLREEAAKAAGKSQEIERERDVAQQLSQQLTSEVASLKSAQTSLQESTKKRIAEALEDAERRIAEADATADRKIDEIRAETRKEIETEHGKCAILARNNAVLEKQLSTAAETAEERLKDAHAAADKRVEDAQRASAIELSRAIAQSEIASKSAIEQVRDEAARTEARLRSEIEQLASKVEELKAAASEKK